MRTTYVIMIAAAAFLAITGCSESDPVGPVDTGGGPDDLTLVKAEDMTGNNLSFPVLWAEGWSLPLRGAFGETMFLGQSTVIDEVEYFHQHDALNEWQAESADISGAPLDLHWIDWGDNLEARPWSERSKVRVETVLFQDLATPMVGYEMGWISGLGIDELWGTNTFTYESAQATVYSHAARLTIQKLTADVQEAVLTWDAGQGAWTGDITAPFYNSAVWMDGNSPRDRYSAEINVKGKVIYGMLWDVKTHGDGEGIYRITFSLDSVNGVVPANLFITDATQIVVPEEEEEESANKSEPTGGVVGIDPVNNLTWIDVPIVPAGGGGGHNTTDPPGGGGGHGGGGHR
jgi:hypothetical protein